MRRAMNQNYRSFSSELKYSPLPEIHVPMLAIGELGLKKIIYTVPKNDPKLDKERRGKPGRTWTDQLGDTWLTNKIDELRQMTKVRLER